MKKITLLLFTFCAFAFVGNAQITGSSSPAIDLTPFDNMPTGVDDSINISGTTGGVTTVEVDINISHTWVGDLAVTLTAPDGTTSTTLFDRIGVPATGFGCADDDVVTSIGDAPYGSGVPEGICDGGLGIDAGPYEAADADGVVITLATVFGGVADANGNWTMNVSDNAGGDNGTWNSWGIRIFGPSLGLGENVLEGFEYSPNPVKDVLTLKAANSIEAVSVYNLLGQEVMRANPNAISSELNMSSLNSGAYFVKVSVGDATKTVRVLKQ